jgi:hypothetical protein
MAQSLSASGHFDLKRTKRPRPRPRPRIKGTRLARRQISKTDAVVHAEGQMKYTLHNNIEAIDFGVIQNMPTTPMVRT